MLHPSVQMGSSGFVVLAEIWVSAFIAGLALTPLVSFDSTDTGISICDWNIRGHFSVFCSLFFAVNEHCFR